MRLSEWADVRVKKFSKGMTQRLGLAAAMIHDPEVLLLDEPTDGVDPVGRREIRDLLQEEAKRGKTVLLNSHLLSEIERTCDRVAVLRGGRVAAAGRIEDLTASGSRYKLVATGVDDALLAAFRETGASVQRVNGHFDLSARDLDHLNALVDRLRAAGGKLQELTPMRTSLEDVFVDLVRESGGGAHGDRRARRRASVMRAFVASVQEVFREAAARWTLIAYFALSTLFILIFAAAVNLDIVDGALAGMKLFGQTVDLPDARSGSTSSSSGSSPASPASCTSWALFLALFATAHLVPRLQEKGTIDLYLSRPIGRVSLLLSRYAGGLLLAAANVVYLIGAIWLIVAGRRRCSIRGSCCRAS